jgi:diguanylate cyclase (GGDEF)-like protein
MLDIKTITVLIILSSLAVAPVMLMAARRYEGYIGRAIKYWGIGLIVSGVGHSLMVLRQIAPDFIAIILANTLVVAGFVGCNLAVCELKQKSLKLSYYYVVLAITFILFNGFLYYSNNVTARILVANLSLISLLLPLCRELLIKIPTGRRPTYWPAGILFGWGVLMLAIRTIATIQGYYSVHVNLFADSAMQTLLFLSSFLVSGVAGMFFMLMAVDEFAAQTSRFASFDSLTEIFNRRAFEEKACQALKTGKKSDASDALLIFDLDHFKSVNDRYGHAAGDLALKKVTEAVSAELRAGDIFGRYGGEEFCVLLPKTGLDEAQVVAERLRQTIQKLSIPVSDTALSLTISIGISTGAFQEKDLGVLFNESDQALYKAKSKGRNRIELADDICS